MIISRENIRQESPLPQITIKNPKIEILEGKIEKNGTLISILEKNGISPVTALKMLKEIKPVYNLQYLRVGNRYEIRLKDHQIISLKYVIGPKVYLLAERNQDKFRGEILKVKYQTKTQFIKGIIKETLFNSILKLKEKPELADLLASLFEYDIDFNTDIRKGDSYKLIIEKKYLKNQFIKYGNIIACEFKNNKKKIQILRYTDPAGKTSFFHPDGRAVKKMFLRCPLPFMKITSPFGFRRHPVYKFSAKHNGVDFRAPIGTKIRSTANGIVQKTGYSKSRGRYVIIKHPNKYYTHYYHLSKKSKRIKRGIRVKQGQIIGYVGNSGISTGPHLHYGIKKQFRFINPLRLKSPSKSPVKKNYFPHFNNYKNQILYNLAGFSENKQFEILRTTIEIMKISSRIF